MRSILVSTNGTPVLAYYKALPTEYWPTGLTVVTTLEIVLSYEDENFVLASYFGYPTGVELGEKVREGHWAPPAIATSGPNLGEQVPKSGRRVIELFSKHPSDGESETDVGKLMSMIGVDDADPTHMGETIEIKPSMREPHIKRAYRIIRYRWAPKDPNPDELRNLVDPLCHRGFAFIPTKRATLKTYTRSGRIPRENQELFFLGKPVVSNLRRLLCNNQGSFKTGTGVVKVTRDHLVLQEKGALIQVDMAGFGAACALSDDQSTFVRKGGEEAEALRHRLLASFSTILARAGISQARLAGDGFLCGIPRRTGDECSVEQRVERFLDAYQDHLKLIERMNAGLSPKHRAKYAIGSRMAIHYGPYNYGRVAGLVPLVADFDGEQIIKVARAEAGLKQIARKIGGRRKAGHLAIVTPEAMAELGGSAGLGELMNRMGFKGKGSKRGRAKEASISGNVFSWSCVPSSATRSSTKRKKPVIKRR